MYFLALSTERAWKQRKPSSNQHTQCLDLGFLMVLYYKWNQDSLETWQIPGQGKYMIS